MRGRDPRPRTDRAATPRARRALSHHAGTLRIDGDRAAADRLAAAFHAARDGDPRELTHGFHSYPARFHAHLVRTLLAGRPPGTRVCDPFCGSGTTLVEALVAGARGFGSDLSVLAVELTRIKALAPTTPQRTLPDELVAQARVLAEASLQRVKDRARTKTSGEAWDDPRMYAAHVFRELVGLRELFDEPPAKMGALVRRALLFCFSAILIKVSRQPSETAAGTVERAIGKGLPTRMFLRKAEELAERLRTLWERVPPTTPNPVLRQTDASRLKHLEDASIDVIVTSPPYLGTFDYARHHDRRTGWLELDAGPLERGEIGARRNSAQPASAMAAWQAQLDAVVAEMARVLAPTGAAFIVIGDSRVGAQAVPGDRVVRGAAERAGLRIVASAAEERRIGGRPTREHLLHLAR